VDAVSGEASAPASAAVTVSAGAKLSKNDKAKQSVTAKSAEQQKVADDTAQEGQAPEVKFFLWEIIQSVVHFFKNLFS
jgi:stage II sporulation protein R